MKKAKKPKHPTRKPQAWTPFAEADGSWSAMDPEITARVMAREPPQRIYKNSLYTVTVSPSRMLTEGGEPLLHLDVKRNDKAAIHDWRHLQRIKNELVGPEHEAIEVYPAESRLVDTANSFHLWVLPPGAKVPVGWTERAVIDGDDVYRPGHARQRRWEEGQRPEDALTPAEAEAKVRAALDREREENLEPRAVQEAEEGRTP